jgi:hypothetical protein
MGVLMLQKQVLTVPISEGLDNKTDEKQVMAGKALTLENARFFKIGKLQKRFGLVPLTTSSNDGLFASAELRSIVGDNDYLSTVTSNGVYAYSEGDDEWYKQAPYTLSSKIQTQFVSKNQFNQRWPDFDITSDGTHQVFLCVQNSLTTAFNSSLLIVLEDVSTGLRKTASINLSSASKLRGGRCIVMKDNGTLYVHVYYFNGNTVLRTIYDENLSPITSGVTIIATSGVGAQFDICKDDTKIYLAHLLGTTLDLLVYSPPGVQQDDRIVTVANAINTVATFGRGLSIVQTTNNIHVAWCGTADVILRGFDKALANAVTEAALSTSELEKVSMCANGNTLVIVNDSEESNSEDCFVDYTTATFTTTYTFSSTTSLQRLNIAAQPFVVNGKNFLICKTNEEENKSFFLYNLTDSYIAQKFSPNLASSQSIDTSTVDAMVSKTVVLNNVAKTNLTRFSILSGSEDIDQVSSCSLNSHDFTQSISDNGKFKLGNSIYQVSGSVMEFDKLSVYENGFMFTPKITTVAGVAGVANPNVSSKTFSYVAMYEFYSAQGERVFSEPSPAVSITTGANIERIDISVRSLVLSLKSKLASNNFDSNVGIVLYRTLNGGSVFYRTTTSIMTFNNGNVEVISDTASDASISDNEQLYTTGNVLENNPPPPAKFAVAGGNRLFLGGIEERDEIAYSKKQIFGEALLFSDIYRIRISSGTSADKTPISALGYMDGKLIVFRQQSIYYIQGEGPNELGTGSFNDPEIISSDTGCAEPRSVLNTPNGIMFKSSKGIYLLDRSLGTSYIGSPVEDYNNESIVASIMHNKFNEARFYTDQGKCLVYNLAFDKWSVFLNQSSIDAENWQSEPVSIKSNIVYKETENTFLDGTDTIQMKLATPWLKLNGLQDYQRIWRAWILGEFKSAHTLIVKAYYNYDDSYSETFTISPLVGDGQYQYSTHFRKQKCESIKLEIYDSSIVGESMELSALTFEVGMRQGAYKLPAARKY